MDIKQWWKENSFEVIRKDLKLVKDYTDSYATWILCLGDDMVKVGCGSLRSLWNETKPNGNYTRFDRALVCYCASQDDYCRALATYTVGMLESEGVVLKNRQGWKNSKYVPRRDIVFPVNMGYKDRDMVLGDPMFCVNGTEYWAAEDLKLFGLRIRNC